MKKVALLIPGLLRTYKRTSKFLFHNIIEPNMQEYDIDIYLGFWDHSHQRGSGGIRNDIKRISTKEIDEILDLYKPKKYIILDDYETKNKVEFPQIANDIIKTIGWPNHPDGLSLIQNGLVAQTYTWYKTHSILEGDYDYIIKSRFDIATEKILFSELKDNAFNCAGPEHQYSQYNLADALFCGNKNLMEKIMSTYHEDILNNKIQNISDFYPNVFPEWVLKDYLYRNGLKINYLDKKVYIVR